MTPQAPWPAMLQRLFARLFRREPEADPEVLSRQRRLLAEELAKTERRMKAKGCSNCVYEDATPSQKRLISQAGALRKELSRLDKALHRSRAS